MQISKESARVTPFQLTILVTSRLPSLRVLETEAVALLPSSRTVAGEPVTTVVHSLWAVSITVCARDQLIHSSLSPLATWAVVMVLQSWGPVGRPGDADLEGVSHRGDAVPVDDLGDFQAAELAGVGDRSTSCTAGGR